MIETPQLVIATGGLSIPKIGATDFGYRIARQFGLRLIEPRPALVPLTFDGGDWAPFAELAGLALPVLIETGPLDASVLGVRAQIPLACGPPFGCFASLRSEITI